MFLHKYELFICSLKCAWCTMTGFQCYPDKWNGPDSKQGSRCQKRNIINSVIVCFSMTFWTLFTPEIAPSKSESIHAFTRPPSPLCLKQPSSVLTAVSLQRGTEGDDACAPRLPLFLPASGRETFRYECW